MTTKFALLCLALVAVAVALPVGTTRPPPSSLECGSHGRDHAQIDLGVLMQTRKLVMSRKTRSPLLRTSPSLSTRRTPRSPPPSGAAGGAAGIAGTCTSRTDTIGTIVTTRTAITRTGLLPPNVAQFVVSSPNLFCRDMLRTAFRYFTRRIVSPQAPPTPPQPSPPHPHRQGHRRLRRPWRRRPFVQVPRRAVDH